MLIKRTSLLTQKHHELEVPITVDQYNRYMNNPNILIQDAFPKLSKEYREYIKSGITPEEWENEFGNGEEDFFEEDDDPDEYDDYFGAPYPQDNGPTGHGDICYSDADPGM